MSAATGGSFLFPVRTISRSKTIPVLVTTARDSIQNPPFLITLNPLVESCTQSPIDPFLWTITDKLKWMGISFNSSYNARFRLVEDGVDCEVNAPAGLHLRSSWRARNAMGGCEVTETVAVQGFFLLMPFVLHNLRASHAQLLEAMATALQKPGTDRRKFSVQSPPVSQENISWRETLVFIFGLIPIPLSSTLYLPPAFKHYILFITVFFFVVLALKKLARRARDPYGDFHLVLNRRPDHDGLAAQDTEWLNMGYWKNTNIFPEACEALALRLIAAGNCVPGGHVLDVGHACGDSLLLHLRHPSVPRPASLTGITSLMQHHYRSAQRISMAQRKEDASPAIYLYPGDAVFRPDCRPRGHPLDPSSNRPKFTSILALDCAYHFDTRKTFLEESYARLEKGGSVALADLCLSMQSGSVMSAARRWLLATALSIRTANILTKDEYVKMVKDVGFAECQVEDITQDVFPGFRQFLRSRGGMWKIMEQYGIGAWVRSDGRFILVSAKKIVPEACSNTL
ncbi:hypothetical protein SISNIDRAFT_330150 [Sistotremastrum niveocremeum HHB9708]|uniref:DUF7053 domain-containing protein n=2 Tax=Sistotremastraceae TaxID=3402574 RepID=A0A164XFQ4_9AGAM|nr:hypothetical protein SISNIDRAFT_330150 [Sistotremastrum niveocremeum HHB9708]KZT41345.1 hypothetical protein SISSUDRAFT_303304 [Sistotremastrum suecicum HHB10207 ss-3]